MSIELANAFVHCPRCGTAIAQPGRNPMKCDACGYTHFFSPTAAVAGIVVDDQQRILFLHRSRDPGKGKLGLPGGFIDAGESAEDALSREVFEEVNLRIDRIDFLLSAPNIYDFEGVRLPVCDLFFTCQVESLGELKVQESEVAGYEFLSPTADVLANMAFDSNRQAVIAFLKTAAG